jgi:hypothetical protein
MLVTSSSSGWRKTSRTWRRNSGSSSKKSTSLSASETSPGIGMWPPPISPISEMVWWEGRNGQVATHAVRLPVRPATRWMEDAIRVLRCEADQTISAGFLRLAMRIRDDQILVANSEISTIHVRQVPENLVC